MKKSYFNEIFKNSRTILELKNHNFDICIGNRESLELWKNVRTLLSDNNFKEMLKHMDLDKKTFSKLLDTDRNASITVLKDWEILFKKILNEEDYENFSHTPPEFAITTPFVNYAKKNLSEFIEELYNVDIASNIINKMVDAIKSELFNISGKVLALEFNYYKDSNGSLSLEEYVKYNFKSIDNYVTLFQKYPTLARIITIRTDYLLSHYQEILQRINNDYKEIKSFIKIENEKLNLTDINLSTGDSHKKGKSVCILEFENKKLVYKPKNLEINKAIKDFSDWFTEMFTLKDLKFPNGIYKKNYSYEEYITFDPCKNENEVINFYRRYGHLIGLSYLFNITDIHVENLVAQGAYPVIIDIETSFQNKSPINMDYFFIKLFNSVNLDSIKSSSLLPRSVKIELMDEDIDMGALIENKDKKINEKFLIPVRHSDDDFHYEKVGEGIVPAGYNVPYTYDNKKIDYYDYSNFIVEGFIDFIKTIQDNKDIVIEKIKNFSDYKIRILLKGTEKYSSMIRISNHPKYNQKMKYRERFLMNIWAYPYSDKRPVVNEMNDLLFNDVPIFETSINSKNLIDSNGNVYENYFDISGKNKVITKIKNLNENEILTQKAILLTTLGIADQYLNSTTSLINLNKNLYFANISNNTSDIYDYIFQKSIKDKEKLSFITLDCDNEQKWSVVPANESLYEGLSGVALLYLMKYIVDKNEKYYLYYKMYMKSSIEIAETKGLINAFQGYLAPLYPILLEKKYLKKTYFNQYIKKISERLSEVNSENIKQIKKYDFITGISGIITLLSSSKKVFGNEVFDNEVIQLFSNVLKSKLQDKQYINSIENSGFAHGLSGMVFSLVVSNNITNDNIIELLEIEKSIYIPEEDKYKWCKGLVGKIQAILKIIEYKNELEKKFNVGYLLKQFEQLLNNIPQDDCLCHGTSGILTTLKMVYNYTKDEKWNEYIKAIQSQMYINNNLDSYKIKRILNIELLGLFDGLSGIAWSDLYLNNNIENVQIFEI